MDGISDLLGSIEAGRSEPSAIDETVNDGGWVEPNAVVSPPASVGDVAPPPSYVFPQSSGETDSAGTVYDPNIHSPNRTKNTNGTWRRKPGAKNAPIIVAPDDQRRQGCRKAAEEIVGQFLVLAIAIGGEEWKPIDELNEREGMIGAWEQYFYDHGIVKMPSWIAIVIVTGGYAAIRCTMPKTQERFKKIMEWIQSKRKGSQENVVGNSGRVGPVGWSGVGNNGDNGTRRDTMQG